MAHLTVSETTPGLIFLGSIRNQAEKATWNQPVSSIPLRFSASVSASLFPQFEFLLPSVESDSGSVSQIYPFFSKVLFWSCCFITGIETLTKILGVNVQIEFQGKLCYSCGLKKRKYMNAYVLHSCINQTFHQCDKTRSEQVKWGRSYIGSLFQTIMVGMCGGLNENGPHKLLYLNA